MKGTKWFESIWCEYIQIYITKVSSYWEQSNDQIQNKTKSKPNAKIKLRYTVAKRKNSFLLLFYWQTWVFRCSSAHFLISCNLLCHILLFTTRWDGSNFSVYMRVWVTSFELLEIKERKKFVKTLQFVWIYSSRFKWSKNTKDEILMIKKHEMSIYIECINFYSSISKPKRYTTQRIFHLTPFFFTINYSTACILNNL